MTDDLSLVKKTLSYTADGCTDAVLKIYNKYLKQGIFKDFGKEPPVYCKAGYRIYFKAYIADEYNPYCWEGSFPHIGFYIDIDKGICPESYLDLAYLAKKGFLTATGMEKRTAEKWKDFISSLFEEVNRETSPYRFIYMRTIKLLASKH